MYQLFCRLYYNKVDNVIDHQDFISNELQNILSVFLFLTPSIHSKITFSTHASSLDLRPQINGNIKVPLVLKIRTFLSEYLKQR